MATAEQIARAKAALGIPQDMTQFADEGVPPPGETGGGHILSSGGGVPLTPKERMQSADYGTMSQAFGASPDKPSPLNPDGPPEEVGIMPDVAGGREESNDFSEGVQWENALNRIGIGPMSAMPRPVIKDEGENFFPGGGAQGRQVYEDTFINKPQEIEQAVNAGADIEKQLQDRRAATIGAEKDRTEHQAAIIAERQAARRQEIQARQAEVDEKVQYYTNDLADTGKFWRNPGNIMAAFGAALMTLASDDHAIGYKLINNAIQQDLHGRQKLADMHLGELRSNLAGYRQIAGDEFNGDLLAEAEAKRVAMMELDRLSAQFAGPKAKAAAMAINKKMAMDVQNLRMHVYASMFYNRPEVMTPQMRAAYEKGGKAVPGVGYTPYGGYPAAPAQPGQGASQGAAAPPGMSLPQSNQTSAGVNGSGAVSPQQRAQFKPSPALMEFFNKRLPSAGRDIEDTLTTLSMKVAAKTRAMPGTPQHTAGMVAEMESATKEANEKGDKFIEYETNRKGWSHADSTMKYIEASLAQTGMNPDQWNGWLRDFTPDGWASKINNLRIKWNHDFPPDTPAGKKAAEQLKALEKFHQMIAGNKVEAYHAFFGGAMNEGELKLAKEMFDTSGSWQNIRGFVEQQSRKAAAQTSGYNMSPLARIIAKGRAGQDFPQSNTKAVEGSKKQPKMIGPPR